MQQETETVKRRRWEAEILISLILLFAVVILWGISFILSYRDGGNSGLWISLFGLANLFLPVIGVFVSLRAIKLRREPQGLARLLLIGHLILIICVMAVYISGLKEVLGA